MSPSIAKAHRVPHQRFEICGFDQKALQIWITLIRSRNIISLHKSQVFCLNWKRFLFLLDIRQKLVFMLMSWSMAGRQKMWELFNILKLRKFGTFSLEYKKGNYINTLVVAKISKLSICYLKWKNPMQIWSLTLRILTKDILH